MGFEVSRQQSNGFQQVILEDKHTATRVAILPGTGALLHEFTIQTGKGTLNIIDNYQDARALQLGLNKSFKSCKLSPFACRIPGGKYTHNNRQYALQHKHADGSSIHGLLYNKPFTVVNEFFDDDQASVLLSYKYQKNDTGYPFEYLCEVQYVLMPDQVLQVLTTVINSGDEIIPLADGWHPYFNLGGIADDWMLQFNASSMLEFNENLVPTGRIVPNVKFMQTESLFGVDLDNCFLLHKATDTVACKLYNPNNKLSVSFIPDDSYPYLQIYIPPDRKSIAIENLSGAPDCFNNKMGLLLLPPGQSKTFKVYYKTNIE